MKSKFLLIIAVVCIVGIFIGYNTINIPFGSSGDATGLTDIFDLFLGGGLIGIAGITFIIVIIVFAIKNF